MVPVHRGSLWLRYPLPAMRPVARTRHRHSHEDPSVATGHEATRFDRQQLLSMFSTYTSQLCAGRAALGRGLIFPSGAAQVRFWWPRIHECVSYHMTQARLNRALLLLLFLSAIGTSLHSWHRNILVAIGLTTDKGRSRGWMCRQRMTTADLRPNPGVKSTRPLFELANPIAGWIRKKKIRPSRRREI